MNPPPLSRVPVVAILSLWLLVVPAGAALALSGVILQPDAAPLVSGSGENVSASFTVTPYGTTTFPAGHELQMETGLSNATWNTRITVDGRAAAEQGGTGPVLFINGYLLSFGTGTDVAIMVNVSGGVPDTPGQGVTLFSVKELDNSGVTVPGSVISISRPVAVPEGTAPPARTGLLSPAPSLQTAGTAFLPTTRAGGWGAAAVLAACAAAVLFTRSCRKRP